MELFHQTYTHVDPGTGQKVRKKTRTWYTKVKNPETGRWEAVSLKTSNKAAAKQLAAEHLLKAERQRLGLHQPHEDHANVPLARHLDDWRAAMIARGASELHAEKCYKRVKAVLQVGKLVFIRQLNEAAVSMAVASIVKRDGLAQSTGNFYLAHAKAFSRWLKRNKRAPDHALDALSLPKVTKFMHLRRALSPAELGRLLSATLASKRMFRGLTGRDRHALYLVAMASGLRLGECLRLAPASFRLDDDPPVVLVPAAYTKNKQIAEQPLPSDVARVLRDYLASQPAGPLWRGTGRWYANHEGNDLIRADLAEAGIPYEVPGPHGTEFADFQCLRHSYVTNVVESGVSVKMAQTLARHSTPTLTIGRYAHVQRGEKGKAVERLANLVQILSTPEPGDTRASVHKDGSV